MDKAFIDPRIHYTCCNLIFSRLMLLVSEADPQNCIQYSSLYNKLCIGLDYKKMEVTLINNRGTDAHIVNGPVRFTCFTVVP